MLVEYITTETLTLEVTKKMCVYNGLAQVLFPSLPPAGLVALVPSCSQPGAGCSVSTWGEPRGGARREMKIWSSILDVGRLETRIHREHWFGSSQSRGNWSYIPCADPQHGCVNWKLNVWKEYCENPQVSGMGSVKSTCCERCSFFSAWPSKAEALLYRVLRNFNSYWNHAQDIIRYKNNFYVGLHRLYIQRWEETYFRIIRWWGIYTRCMQRFMHFSKTVSYYLKVWIHILYRNLLLVYYRYSEPITESLKQIITFFLYHRIKES